nr:flagellar hook-length control protein FliK [Leifsonia sp. C5G2]
MTASSDPTLPTRTDTPPAASVTAAPAATPADAGPTTPSTPAAATTQGAAGAGSRGVQPPSPAAPPSDAVAVSTPTVPAATAPLAEAAAVAKPKTAAVEAPAPPPAAAPAPAPVAVDRTAPAAPAAAPAPAASTPQPLATQLARPVFTLAAAGAGEHVMTVHVRPDNLGPVTVRAHVGGEGVRVELFAPTDLGRDALRAILPDLRRDLTGAGLTGTLDLSSQNQPTAQQDARDGGRQDPAPHGTEPRPTVAAAASTRSTPSAPADGSSHSIDLIV